MDKKRILLVEDEKVTATDLESDLIQLGYEVPAIASRGEDAIRLASEMRPDLVLMDITLDGPLSGIDAAVEIRKAHGIPVVFLTAHIDAGTFGLAMTADPFGFLPKPSSLASLMTAIELALRNGEAAARQRKAEARLSQVMEEQRVILHDYQTHLEEMVVKRTEELSESEKKYRNLFELAEDAIFVADIETGVIIDANLRAELLLGRDRSEIIGMHQSAVHPPEEAARYQELFKRAAAEGSSRLWEEDADVSVIRKDGRKIPVEVDSSRLDLAGRSVLVGVFKDVRQKKMQEEALMLLKKAVDAIPLGVTVMDRSGSIVYVNKAEAGFQGRQRPEIIGRQSRNCSFTATPPENRRNSTTLQSEGFTTEYENVRTDGSVCPVEITAVPVRSDSGELIARISVSRDISDRKRAETALEERERKYRDLYQQFAAVLDVIPEVMILLTADLRLKWINKTSDPDIFRETAMPGARCCDIFRLCGGPESCPVRTTLYSGEATGRQVHTDNGRVLDMRTFPVFDEGGSGSIGHALCVISDVTEKLRLYERTARANQLATIGELSAGVAHEINNPVNSIINYAQLLLDDAAPESESGKLGERILREGCRIEGIVNGLLSFARHRPKEKTRCGLADMINEVLLLLRAELTREGIRVTVELAPGLPAITVNRQQIEQVLMNLLNNARYALNKKYGELSEKKTIEIRGRTGQGEAGRLLIVSVLDSGCGVPADVLPKVMNPFFTTKPPGRGTGLGLSICLGIIQEHGGRLDIRSREHLFTEVTVALPAGGSEDGIIGQGVDRR